MRAAMLLSSLIVLAGCTAVETRDQTLRDPGDGAVVMRYLPNVYPNAVHYRGTITAENVTSQGQTVGTHYQIPDFSLTSSPSTVFIATLPSGTYKLVASCESPYGACTSSRRSSRSFTVKPGQITDLGVMVNTVVRGKRADAYGSPTEPQVTAQLVQALAPGLKSLLQAPVLTWNETGAGDTAGQVFEASKRASIGVFSVQPLADGDFLYGSLNGVVYHWTPGQLPVPHDIGLRVAVESVLATPAGRWLAGGELGVLQASSDQGKSWASIRSDLPFGDVTGLAYWHGQIVATVMEGKHVGIYIASENGGNWTRLARHALDVTLWDPGLMLARSTLVGDRLITTVPGHKLATLDLATGRSDLRELPGTVATLSVGHDGKLLSTCPSGVSGDACESRDQGKTWTRTGPVPFSPGPVFRDANIGVGLAGKLFSQTYLAYTRDGGSTWINATPVEPDLSTLFYNRAGQKVYAGSQTGEFWESDDDGLHWKRLTKGWQ